MVLRGGRIADAIITNVRRAERLVNGRGPDADAPNTPGTPNTNAPNNPRPDATNPPRTDRPDTPDTDGDAPRSETTDAEANDLPNGPASSAANQARLREQLAARELADLNRATTEITDIRARVPLANPRVPGNVAVADINISGLPDTRLAAHSQVDTPQAGLVGRGSQNFDFTSERNASGGFNPRNTDAEYKILDAIADRLRGNPNASGSINLFTELPPCASCSRVIDQFRVRFPNITVNVTTVQRQLPPPPQPVR